MSERLGNTSEDYTDSGHIEEAKKTEEEATTEQWTTGDHYSRMKIDAGVLGNIFYYNIPTFTILAKTKEELAEINDDFSTLLSKYTDSILVGSSHEASLVLSLNQAASDLSVNGEIIATLRERIAELMGNQEEAAS
jgi:hypothetical protein